MSAEAKAINPPPPPTETCRECGKVYDQALNDDWQSRWHSSFGPALAQRFCYTRIEHPECQEAISKRAEREEAEHTRLLREEHVRREAEQRQEEFNHWYSNGAFPLEVRSKTFASYQDDGKNAKSLSLLKKWREGDDFGFLLYGPSGTGKSHLGFALMNTLLQAHLAKAQPYYDWRSGEVTRERFRLPHYESVASMLSAMRGTSGELTYQQANSPVLFLDDLGAESITEWSREIFFRLFEHRLNRRLPVIVTSNLSLKELRERMHDRVVSRILGLCIPLQIDGDDRRKGLLADRVKLLAARTE